MEAFTSLFLFAVSLFTVVLLDPNDLGGKSLFTLASFLVREDEGSILGCQLCCNLL
jgi:hypothetical protein